MFGPRFHYDKQGIILLLDIILAGGWLMLPIVICSIVALGIIFERYYALQAKRITPAETAALAEKWASAAKIDDERLIDLQGDSPLGRVLAAGLANSDCSREVMKDAIEEVGRLEAHNLANHLNALGTIAAITPLLGLLGTVIGMISVFTTITTAGVGNPTTLAGGISQALMTTAAGLSVAIPALIFSRYFQRRVADLVVEMEQAALKLVETLSSGRRSPQRAAPRAKLQAAKSSTGKTQAAPAKAKRASP